MTRSKTAFSFVLGSSLLFAFAATAQVSGSGAFPAERADASWCHIAGLSGADSRGCVARMNTAATDQQRADIQATYRGRAGAGSGAVTRSAGGGSPADKRLDGGLNVGAGESR